MTAFISKWTDWEPETLRQRTDRTDKRASVSSVSTLAIHIQGKNVDSDQKKDTPDASTQRTDRTDKRSDRDVTGAGANSKQKVIEGREAILQFDGGFSQEEAERRAAVETETVRVVDSSNAWDAEIAFIVDWFLTAIPPEGPFELYPHVHVARPEGYWQDMRTNIRLGPGGPRARWGALQKDLRRLAELFGGPGG